MRVIIIIAIILTIFVSGCIQSSSEIDDTLNNQSIFPNKAASFIPTHLDLSKQWMPTEESEQTVDAEGFESGYKLRLTRAEDISRIIARVTVYNFDSNKQAADFHDGYQLGDTPLELELSNCRTTRRTEIDLELTKATCVSESVFYRVDITGNKYNSTESDLTEIVNIINTKIISRNL